MTDQNLKDHLRNLIKVWSIPPDHVSYLKKLKNEFNVYPKVIYDIGACILGWSEEAQKIWPDSKIYAFDAMDSVEFLYQEKEIEYYIGVLSDKDEKDVIFYQSDYSPGGNSYYKEDSWATKIYYNKDSERRVKTMTLDTVVNNKNFKYPNLIKIDTQGSEIDILRGMSNILPHCENLIVELQHGQYNIGAMLNTESIPIIESMGFELVTELFCNNGIDGDYHFKRIKK